VPTSLLYSQDPEENAGIGLFGHISSSERNSGTMRAAKTMPYTPCFPQASTLCSLFGPPTIM